MGNFWTMVKRGLYWIWKIIKQIIEWLCSIVKMIFRDTAFFLNKHEEKIKSADNPKNVGKIAAINKIIKGLQNVKKEYQKDCTTKDLGLIKELTADDDDFNKSVDSDFFDKEIDKMIKDNNI